MGLMLASVAPWCLSYSWVEATITRDQHDSAHAQLNKCVQRGTMPQTTITGMKPFCLIVTTGFFIFPFLFLCLYIGVKGVCVGVDPQVKSRDYI